MELVQEDRDLGLEGVWEEAAEIEREVSAPVPAECAYALCVGKKFPINWGCRATSRSAPNAARS